MMSEASKELNELIKGLRSQLPDSVRVELIGDDEIAREAQSQPGQALPPALLAQISQAAEALAQQIFGSDAIVEMSQVALKSLFKEKPHQAKCYHYILDDKDQPILVDDDEEAHRFQVAKRDILATQVIDCDGIETRLTTRFVVHNPVESDEIPKPHWVTELFREYTGELIVHEESHSIDEARAMHRKVREEIMQSLTKESANE